MDITTVYYDQFNGDYFRHDEFGNRVLIHNERHPQKVSKLKDQRRRNALTIEARNAEIRDLKARVEDYKEIIADYRTAYRIVHGLLEDQIKKHGGL